MAGLAAFYQTFPRRPLKRKRLAVCAEIAGALLLAPLAVPWVIPTAQANVCKTCKPPKVEVTSVTPRADDQSVEISGTHMASAAKIFFGFHESPKIQYLPKSQTIEAVVPKNPDGGSIVSVSAVNTLGEVGTTTSTFTYPVAETQLEGPQAANFCNDGVAEWSAPTAFGGDFTEFENRSAVSFDTSSPRFLIMTSFVNTGQAETNPTDKITEEGRQLNRDQCEVPRSHKQPDENIAGDHGDVTAILYLCEVEEATNPERAEPKSSSSCTDYSGAKGSYHEVETRFSSTLSTTSPGPQRLELQTSFPNAGEASGQYYSEAGSSFFQEREGLVNGKYKLGGLVYARTFLLEICPQMQAAKNRLTWNGGYTSCESKRFTAVITPVGALQLTVQPQTILYQPPGDQSTASQTLEDVFATNYKLGESTEKSNSHSEDLSNGWKESVEESLGGKGEGGGATLSATLSGGESLDTTVKNDVGTAKTSSEEKTNKVSFGLTETTPPRQEVIPGSGQICEHGGGPFGWNCQGTSLPYEKEYLTRQPFEEDEFVFLVHPQYLVYHPGGGAYKIEMYGAAPATVSFYVWQLVLCATEGELMNGKHWCSEKTGLEHVVVKNGETVRESELGTITLTPDEARTFLGLDPFVAAGQNAVLPAERAVPFGPSKHYGLTGEEPSPGKAPELVEKNTEVAGEAVGTSETETEATTHVWATEESFGAKLGFTGGPLGLGISFGESENAKETNSQSLKQTYSDSTAVSTEEVSSAKVSFKDADSRSCSGCHQPIPNLPDVQTYLDRTFGTFMFRDPEAPASTLGELVKKVKWPIGLLNERLFAHVAFLQAKKNFEDVAPGTAGSGAAALLVTNGFMSDPRASFKPTDPFTEADLSLALDALGRLPAGSEVGFPGSAYSPGQAVTEKGLFAILEKTFGLSQKKLMKTLAAELPGGEFREAETLERIQAAPVLLKIFATKCLKSCHKVAKRIPLVSPTPPPPAPTTSVLTLSCPGNATVGNVMEVTGKLDPAGAGDGVSLTYTPRSGGRVVQHAVMTSGEGGFRDQFVSQTPEEYVIEASWPGSTNVLAAKGECDLAVAGFSLVGGGTIHTQQGQQAALAVGTTALGKGEAPEVTFVAAGIPPSTSASFEPPSVTAGEATTLTIDTSEGTPAGTYEVTVAGTGIRPAPTVEYTVIVEGAATPHARFSATTFDPQSALLTGGRRSFQG